MDIVTVRGLTKAYRGFTLDSVSFSLAAGRIAGFIGRNGAGKTTAIKSMLNLVHPDGGEVCYFGMPLAGNEAQVKKRLGYSTGTIGWPTRNGRAAPPCPTSRSAHDSRRYTAPRSTAC
ncbi:MAG: ATP-binding cassette domain-containing protein [Coriobacteriales bacterium]|jgi:ABC-2 type transport system ATP-binding protein|nr:ATP-binding cassette domain-containing protein [Coriobacteriales bacterium]